MFSLQHINFFWMCVFLNYDSNDFFGFDLIFETQFFSVIW